MLIDMIHENLGEPPIKTRYRDPALLRAYGYEAIAIPHALSFIPAAYDDAPPSPTAPIRNPIDLESEIDARIKAALAANLQIFFYADAPQLPRSIINKNPAAYLCDDGSNRLCPAKPAVLTALQDQIHELFDRWPAAAGLIMRTGDIRTDAAPHMLGTALHSANCETCRNVPLQQRYINFIRAMHDTVITDLQKIYVHRMWQPTIPGLPNMHDDPATYLAIASQLPESPLLAFSFKVGRNDQRPASKFSPCLTADRRPKWIEFQSERENEGKGAFPNYQAPQWQEFLQQLQRATGETNFTDVDSRFSLFGWSRGGGWGGPYAQREEWIDANVFALAELYRDPSLDLRALTTTWVSRTFDVAESSPQAPALTELLMLSAPAIRKLLTVSNVPSYGDPPWLRDDYLDVSGIWNSAMRAVDFGKTRDACEEKAEALRDIHRIRQLFDLASPDLPNRAQTRALATSIDYLASFAGAVGKLFIGFATFIHWSRTGGSDAALAHEAIQSLEQSQTYWQQNIQRHALLPSAPSVFQESNFWDRTNDCLEQLHASAGALP